MGTWIKTDNFKTFSILQNFSSLFQEIKMAAVAAKPGPDMELRRAFVELQSKMVDAKQKMKMADWKVENYKRSIKHTELTVDEIKSLPEETRLYESVGRMFMLSTRSGITGTLDKKQEKLNEEIKNLEAKKTYLEKSLKDSENSLRELVAQKKA